MSRYKTLFVPAVLVLSLLQPLPALSFYTWPVISSKVHDEITHVLVEKDGFQEAAFANIVEWMDDQDIPGSDAFIDATNHFDDGQLNRSYQKLLSNRDQMVGAAENAHRDIQALNETYRYFGYILHAAQDFYSHTNYVELHINKPREAIVDKTQDGYAEYLMQDADAIPLVEWESDLDQAYRSGYFYYDSALLFDWEKFNGRANCIAHLKQQSFEGRQPNFLPAADYCRYLKCQPGSPFDPSEYISIYSALDMAVDLNAKGHDTLHAFLNKDGDNTPMGKATLPNGKTLFEVARHLAVKETRRQWEEIEKRIRGAYPDEAEDIIAAIKGSYGLAGPLHISYAMHAEGDLQVVRGFAAGSRVGGTKDLGAELTARVDWKTGEIAGRGFMRNGSGTNMDGEALIHGVQQGYAQGRPVSENDTAAVYVTGWLADGGKKIKLLRIYTEQTEKIHATGYDGRGRIDEVTDTEDRLVDTMFGDVPMDGSRQVSNSPVPMQIASIENTYRETESVAVRLDKLPKGVNIPPDYKQTRLDNGDSGPLAAYLGIPAPYNIGQALNQAKDAVRQAQGELAQIQQEMQAEPQAYEDPEDAEMAAEERELLGRLSELLESAGQGFDSGFEE